MAEEGGIPTWGSANVNTAIVVSLGAGLATGIGGAVAFVPQIFASVKQGVILSVALAISAGVMLYVSFIEIFVKSLTGFTDQFLLDGKDEAEAGRHGYYAATGFFFLGMLLTRLLDLALHRLEDAPHSCSSHAKAC